jgi:DNA polymerase-3 subunit alpha
VDPRAVNKRAIEALIKCGAFGSTGATRKGMLGVLEQAQAAGQQAQLDAQIGQGSIFDLGDVGGTDAGAPSPFMAPQHPPIPPEEFEQAELLAIEKEAIGLFISAHPLKEVREALRAVVDAPLTSLPDHKDGDWVTAGGIITQAKKIRTKKGDPMMFATLDDLEGSIEVLIFGKALAEYEGALGVDEVVLVRGRVDHGDKGTSLIAQTVDPFRPTVEEVEAAREAAALEPQGPQALTVSVDATALPATIIEELKHILGNHAGESEVVLAIQTSAGPRTLRLGEGYRVNETPSLRAELGRILGPAALQVG